MCIWTQKLHQDQGLAVWLRPWVDLPCFWTACGYQHDCVFRFAKNDPLETWSTEKSLWDVPSLPKLWEVHQMKRTTHFPEKASNKHQQKWHVTCDMSTWWFARLKFVKLLNNSSRLVCNIDQQWVHCFKSSIPRTNTRQTKVSNRR